MIIYSVCPFPQANPYPGYEQDKWPLVKMCHESFLKAKPSGKVTYLLDRCPQEYYTYFSKHGEVEPFGGIHRMAALRKMFDMAYRIEGNIMFVEDDYLWRPNTIPLIWDALKVFPLISPYDHPGHYIEERFKTFPFKLTLHNGIVWRTAPSNTHTFATTSDYYQKNWHLFSQTMHDHELFTKLPDRIVNPMYSFATHLTENWIAPNVDWEPYLKTFAKP